MENISLLLPSRGRPGNIKRLYDSVMATATYPEAVDLVVVIDDDDQSYDTLKEEGRERLQWIVVPRTLLSVYWNIAYEHAQGPIFMHGGDDIIFRTNGWDVTVSEAFESIEDRILFAHGYDGTPQDDVNFGTHGFLHKNWVDAVGYFVPPYFSSDYNDTWLNDVAKSIGRKRRLPFVTEHMHFTVGKAPVDLTHHERLIRHEQDNVAVLYDSLRDERTADMEKLRAVMH